jgi:protocatechuate 3,4-dioxygenase beta subunit
MPEQEEGPYYVQGPHIRSAITNGKAGLAMTLAVTVVDVTTCQPIPAAAVDVWHADAAGTYSTAADGMFLRGVQLTDEAGIATFTTIYPGWYPGRTNHVHLKVHVGGSLQSDVYQGGHVSHTGNLFFPDDVSAAVARVAPYVSNPVSRTPRDGDFVYKAQNGNRAIIVLDPQSTSVPTGGYQASIVVGINPSATPALIGIHN